MSHKTTAHPRKHGSFRSYTIGFVLSLIFTFIPYYLVQNHNSGTSTVLLMTILGLAVVQLIIQLLFFLHLGRKPQPRWELYFFIATVGMILVVVGASLIIVNNLHKNMAVVDQQKKLVNDEAIAQINGKLTGACQTTHENHQVVIKNDAISPYHISANRCDTLTFVSGDGKSLDIKIGLPDAHSSYAGESELAVRPGKTKTITLSEIGGFNFYDNQHPEIVGSLSVLDEDQGQ
jgi:cytochrome o ubiquinol oxidase operon protein cyoD